MRLFLALVFLSATAFADTETDKIFSLMATLPKVTKAKIKRGNKEIPVDLSQAQIKDYDVIILDEGVYSTLGNSSAKYVRVRGQGPRKTFISSIAKDSAPILVNSTEFWDVTIADAQFKVADQNGLWAVNVEFAGSILVRPAALDKSPAFTIRSIFSDFSNSDFTSPADLKIEEQTPSGLLAYEDKLDRDEKLHLKDRLAYKGLIARGANYLYQTKKFRPQYDQAKYAQLAKQARSAKSKGHHYVAMLAWAEADRLSGHSRFDEVLKEITPLNQVVSQDCGCTVEGQGSATTIKSEIEQKLFTKLPITALPGRCKIQTLHVNIPAGGKKDALIAAARLQNQLDLAVAFKARESEFQQSALAHAAGKSAPEDDFAVGEAAVVAPSKEYTSVADVEMPGLRKSYESEKGKSVDQNIVEPISRSILDKLASRIKAAKAKIASSDLVAKVDGFIAQALYGDELRQNEYESLHEQQFGRKTTPTGAMSSVFAY